MKRNTTNQDATKASKKAKIKHVWVKLDTTEQLEDVDSAELSSPKTNTNNEIVGGMMALADKSKVEVERISKGTFKVRLSRAKKSHTRVWVKIGTFEEVKNVNPSSLTNVSVNEAKEIIQGTWSTADGIKFEIESINLNTLGRRITAAKKDRVWVKLDTPQKIDGVEPAKLLHPTTNKDGEIVSGTWVSAKGTEIEVELLTDTAFRKRKHDAKKDPIWVKLDTAEKIEGIEPAKLLHPTTNKNDEIVSGTWVSAKGTEIEVELLNDTAFRKRKHDVKKDPIWVKLNTTQKIDGVEPAKLLHPTTNKDGEIVSGTLVSVSGSEVEVELISHIKLMTRKSHPKVDKEKGNVWIKEGTTEEVNIETSNITDVITKNNKVVSCTLVGTDGSKTPLIRITKNKLRKLIEKTVNKPDAAQWVWVYAGTLTKISGNIINPLTLADTTANENGEVIRGTWIQRNTNIKVLVERISAQAVKSPKFKIKDALPDDKVRMAQKQLNNKAENLREIQTEQSSAPGLTKEQAKRKQQIENPKNQPLRKKVQQESYLEAESIIPEIPPSDPIKPSEKGDDEAAENNFFSSWIPQIYTTETQPESREQSYRFNLNDYIYNSQTDFLNKPLEKNQISQGSATPPVLEDESFFQNWKPVILTTRPERPQFSGTSVWKSPMTFFNEKFSSQIGMNKEAFLQQKNKVLILDFDQTITINDTFGKKDGRFLRNTVRKGNLRNPKKLKAILAKAREQEYVIFIVTFHNNPLHVGSYIGTLLEDEDLKNLPDNESVMHGRYIYYKNTTKMITCIWGDNEDNKPLDKNAAIKSLLEVMGIATQRMANVILVDDDHNNCAAFNSIGGKSVHAAVDSNDYLLSLSKMIDMEQKIPDSLYGVEYKSPPIRTAGQNK